MAETSARSPTEPERPRRGTWEIFWAFLFAWAATQAPLYYSNQNQYLLHGYAQVGVGTLAEDWLANTRDPTPIFSFAVRWIYSTVGEIGFQVGYFLLLMVYFVSLIRLVEAVFPSLSGTPVGTLWRALVVLAHAGGLRWLSVQLFGFDYPWFLQAGVAGQYVLGPGVQPSVFGLFLLTSLWAFQRGQLFWAVVLACGTATVHSTYLLSAGLLTAGYLAALLREGKSRVALQCALAALLGVLPVVLYNLSQFAPSDSQRFAEAQRLLAEFRIPHHAVVARWFDWIAGLQVAAIVVTAVVIWSRERRLGVVLLVAVTLALALSLVQVLTKNPSLALLFPWRISALLMPIATATLAALGSERLTRWMARSVEGRSTQTAATGEPWHSPKESSHSAEEPKPSAKGHWVWIVPAWTIALGAALSGAVITWTKSAYRSTPDELPVMEFVRQHKRPGEVYFVPVLIPQVSAGKRGSLSTSFMPPPRMDTSKNLIPVDMQRFRLLAQAPIFVDFKSIPYQDAEVLEWHRRLLLADAWTRAEHWPPTLREQWLREGITHVVVPRHRDRLADWLHLEYEDAAYRLYRIVADPAP